MFTCRDRRGCPASFYHDKRCALQEGKNCWEITDGCRVSQCDKNCQQCRAFYPHGKVKTNKKGNLR